LGRVGVDQVEAADRARGGQEGGRTPAGRDPGDHRPGPDPPDDLLVE
jgi:hypothetical protein